MGRAERQKIPSKSAQVHIVILKLLSIVTRIQCYASLISFFHFIYTDLNDHPDEPPHGRIPPIGGEIGTLKRVQGILICVARNEPCNTKTGRRSLLE